jgi:hypothetical protein
MKTRILVAIFLVVGAQELVVGQTRKELLEECNSSRDSLQAQVQQLRGALSALEHQLNVQNEAVRSLQRSYDHLQQRSDELHRRDSAHVDQLNHTVDSLTEDLRLAQDEIADIQSSWKNDAACVASFLDFMTWNFAHAFTQADHWKQTLKYFRDHPTTFREVYNTPLKFDSSKPPRGMFVFVNDTDRALFAFSQTHFVKIRVLGETTDVKSRVFAGESDWFEMHEIDVDKSDGFAEFLIAVIEPVAEDPPKTFFVFTHKSLRVLSGGSYGSQFEELIVDGTFSHNESYYYLHAPDVIDILKELQERRLISCHRCTETAMPDGLLEVKSKWRHTDGDFGEIGQEYSFRLGPIAACIDGDAPVELASGKEIRLRDVVPGDSVVTIDPVTKSRGESSVLEVHKALHYNTVVVVTGRDSIRMTDDHPLLLHDGVWTACSPEKTARLYPGFDQIRQLQIGDLLFSPDGVHQRVEEIVWSNRPEVMFGLRLESNPAGFRTGGVVSGSEEILNVSD